jgi:hypothetical protein
MAGGKFRLVWLVAAVLAFASALPAERAAAASSWSGTRLPGAAGKVFLLGASCPSRSFCVGVGTNNLIASSTNPTGGSGAWDFVYAGEGPWEKTDEWPTEEISGRQIQGVSCPSAQLCVAVTNQGNIYTSTNPTGSAAAWKVTEIEGEGGNTHLFGVSCPSQSLCVAVSGKRNDEGKILTSTNPTGGRSAWQVFELGQPFEFRGVSCGSPSLCVAVDDAGRVVSSTDPTGGASAWKVVGAPAGPGSLQAVSCAGTALCVAGNEGGNLLVSSNPSGGAGGWREVNGGGSVQITGVSCPSASACLAVDNNGDIITSTGPAGGSGAWSFQNILPFTQAEGNALFGASCPTTSLCVATGARGQIFTGVSPFAAAADLPAGQRRSGGRRRGLKRPRVKIASVRLPFRGQLERGRGRVMIRFYARGRVRRYLCRFAGQRWTRCRSPERYRVGVGRYTFRVRAIGVTGLRGPVTRERILVPPFCDRVPPRRRHNCY